MPRVITTHAKIFGEGGQAVYGYTVDGYDDRIKIGHTTVADYLQRIRDQDGTGVPGTLVVRFVYRTDNSRAVESAVHRHFAPHRVPGKEWFRLTAEQVLEGFDEFAIALRGKAEAERRQAAVCASSREAPAQDGQAAGRAHQHVGVIEQIAGGRGARRQPLQPVRVRRPTVRGEQPAGYVNDRQGGSGMAALDQCGRLGG